MSDPAWIGIDPGTLGAVVALDAGGHVVAWYDTPTLTVPGPKRASKKKGHEGEMVATKREKYDKAAMARILWELAGKWEIRCVVIEEVGPMPRRMRQAVPGGAIGQDLGRGSNPFTDFGLGRGLGIWEGICAALELRVEMVPPVSWKAKLIPRVAFAPDTKTTERKRLLKAAARARALELFPAFAEHIARVKDDGRGEAALLAYYGLRYV